VAQRRELEQPAPWSFVIRSEWCKCCLTHTPSSPESKKVNKKPFLCHPRRLRENRLRIVCRQGSAKRKM